MKKAFLFLIIVALTALVACDGGTHLEGYVRDEKGRPVSNATVTLATGGHTRTLPAREDGFYSIGLTHSPFRTAEQLTVRAAGFNEYQRSFSSSDHLRTLDVTLSSSTSQ